MSAPNQSCDVCRDNWRIDECMSHNTLCEQHQKEYDEYRVDRDLRGIIPEHLHGSHPRDLPAGLSDWTGEDHGGLYLYGSVGAGKSHSAAALAKRWYVRHRVDFGFRVAWANVPMTILDTLAAFSSGQDASSIWDRMESASLLILDDIGIETPKDWVRMRLYALVEYRLNKRLPMIVTSNLDLGALSERLGSPQIASRLAQVCTQFSFEGMPDRRLEGL